jgi:UDP-N-acetylmuramoyl-L-alanyl-D-glutamate--2,6-diaminopimelate ligase
MRLSTLLAALPSDLEPTRRILGTPDDDPAIRGIAYDSRLVTSDDLFFALRGSAADGHDYLAQSFERGAAAAIVESVPEHLDPSGRPVVVVSDSRRALAPISTRFFGDPSSELNLIGITGTNGKTSTTYLIESILGQTNARVGLIGTLDIRYAGERQPAVNTTPESCEIQRTLRAMRDSDIETVVMEVSSHGLALGRVAGCTFAVAALTNLTQDHLDFHGTMDIYRDAKARLFDSYLAESGAAVVNIDDPSAGAFLHAAQRAGARIVRVSRHSDIGAEVHLEHAEVKLDGSTARIALPSGSLDLRIPLVGDFNLENTLVACGVAVALEISPQAIADGIANCPQVPGRVERVQTTREIEPTVIVDYAHTPDAIDKLLATLRPLARGRLIAVFGCGGDRDRGKRPLMAEAVAHWSDRIVATSDNPRTEDPLQILKDVEEGLSSLRRVDDESLEHTDGSYAMIPDRRRAIEVAIGIARPDDMVVIAGKGHENYQIVGHERLPFLDRDEARAALDNRSRR